MSIFKINIISLINHVKKPKTLSIMKKSTLLFYIVFIVFIGNVFSQDDSKAVSDTLEKK